MIKEIFLSLVLTLNFELTILKDVKINKNIVPIIKDINQVYTGKLVITSNYRSPKFNQEIGGHINSKHLCGKAIDVRLYTLTEKDIKQLQKLQNYDVIIESDHIHIEKQEEC